jgi:ribose transport system substrate-binding protein
MSVTRRTWRASATALLAVCSLALAAGCGDDSGGSSGGDAASGSSEGKRHKITMLTASNVIPGWLGYDEGAKAAAERLGVDLKFQQWASLEPKDLVAGVNAVVASNPDAALLSAVNAPALQSSLEQAAERLKEVVVFDSPPEDPSFATAYVGSAAAEEGVAAAQKLSELIGGKGKVLHTSAQPSFSTLEINQRAFREEIEQNHPEIELLPLQRDDGDTSKNAAIMRATLARHPDLAGAYLGTSGLGGEGGVQALRSAGKVGQVKVVTLDALPAAVDDLKKGYQQAVISPKLRDLGGGAVEAAVKALNGEPVEKENLVGFCVITKDTLDDPENQQCIFPSK